MIFNSKSKNTIEINGVVYEGNNVSIKNGKVFIDGVEQKDKAITKAKKINLVVNGDIEQVNGGSGNIKANRIGDVSTGSGEIECDTIEGDVKTGSGDIEAKNIEGSVTTASGDVSASSINGSVQTISGDIITKRRMF